MFRHGERELYRDVRSKERGHSIRHRRKKASSNIRMKSLLMVVVAIGFAFYQLSKTWGRSSLKNKFARSEVNTFFVTVIRWVSKFCICCHSFTHTHPSYIYEYFYFCCFVVCGYLSCSTTNNATTTDATETIQLHTHKHNAHYHSS